MIQGYFFAVLTGLFFGLQGAYGKALTKRKLSSQLLSWAVFTFALPYLAFFLLNEGVPTIRWKSFILATLTSFLINLFAWNLFFTALRSSSLAHTMPFTALTPLFIIPIEYLLLRQLPNLLGVVGIVLVFIGAYGIHLNSCNLLQPLKSLFHDKGTRYMLIVALIWSISATVEKIAVVSSSAAFFGLSIYTLLSFAFFLVFLIKKEPFFEPIKTNVTALMLLGLISGMLTICQFTALKTLLVSYVIAFKRAGVLVSVLIGILFFKEPNPIKNMICTSLIVVGVFFILLG
jgi:uncharacterized membrane protein